jgi:hypothetical protein
MFQKFSNYEIRAARRPRQGGAAVWTSGNHTRTICKSNGFTVHAQFQPNVSRGTVFAFLVDGWGGVMNYIVPHARLSCVSKLKFLNPAQKTVQKVYLRMFHA